MSSRNKEKLIRETFKLFLCLKAELLAYHGSEFSEQIVAWLLD